jgi:hypothetical protein
VRATDPLQVWNETPSFDDDEFTPPRKSSGSLDGSVDTAVPVPVTGDEVHIRANHDTAVVYLDRARSIETLLHVDITWVG